MTTRKQKIVLIIFGLFASVLFIEASLRFVGYFYKSYRIDTTRLVHNGGRDTIKILCLGDSFTFGEGAPRGFSYPEQLQRMLNYVPGKKFIVYNGGVPGSNSSFLSKNLGQNIQKYDPDIIVVMTGANNNSNFYQSNYFLFMDKSIKTYRYRLDSYLSYLRSYKLFKTAMVNLCNKIRKVKLKNKFRELIHPDNSNTIKIFGKKETKYIPDQLKEEINKHLELARLYEEQRKVKLAIAECEKIIKLNPDEANAYRFLGFLYLHRCKYLGGAALLLAMQALKRAIEIDPFDDKARWDLFNTYHRLDMTNLAREELETILKLSPNDELAPQLLSFGIPGYKTMEVFKRMLRYDLKNIIGLALSQRVKAIIQSYPGSSWQNGPAREIAKIYKLVFVDNEAIFEKIESSTGYKKDSYFTEDLHLNAEGYKIVAENVYSAIVGELRKTNLK